MADDLDAVIQYGSEVVNKHPLCSNYVELWDYQEPNGANEKVSEVILAAQFSNDESTWGRFGNQMHLYYPSVYQDMAGTSRDISGGREFSYVSATEYTMQVFDRVNDSRFWKSFITCYGANNTAGAPTWTAEDIANGAPANVKAGDKRFVAGELGIKYIVNEPGDGRFEDYATGSSDVKVKKNGVICAPHTRMDDASKIPGANLNRTNFTLRASSTFGKDDRWSLDAKIQYINTGAENRPLVGNTDSNTFLTIYKLPASLDIRDYSNPLTDEGKMYWWSPNGLNPYWLEKYNLNADNRSRFLMNASLKYKITDWLNVELRGGSDMYFTESTEKTYAGASTLNNGNSAYSLNEQRFYENNFSFLFTAQKDNLIDKIGVSATFGGNLMERKSTGLKNRASKLTVPNLFNINNSSKSDRYVTETYSHKKINSLYGTIGLNYNGWVFLDATFRNDWSSALAKENRSFFYPSVSLSWVISDMMNKFNKPLPEWVTYAKARASFAQVGNDMDPYQLYDSYEIGSDQWGNTTAKPGETKYDSTVRSELISSWEAGLEMKFLNNRLGFDIAWYKSNAKRQLMKIPVNEMSGYKNKIINAGNIQNTGIELMINARPVETELFSWDTQINFSKNNNKILDLGPGIPKYELGGAEELKVYAVAGGNYGEIWGTKFARVEDKSSPYYGKLILNEAGLPTTDGERYKIGDQQPDCMIGWNNTLSYKNFAFSFQFDGRIGGDIYSYTNYMLQTSGRAAVTAPDGRRDEFVLDGVVSDGNGGYKPNTTPVTQEAYWKNGIGTGNQGIAEANIYDGTNFRLRNVALNYTFPREMLKKTCFQQVKLGVSVNNVWMIYSDMNGIDPESVMVTSTNATGFEFGASPTSRTYLFNVTLGF